MTHRRTDPQTHRPTHEAAFNLRYSAQWWWQTHTVHSGTIYTVLWVGETLHSAKIPTTKLFVEIEMILISKTHLLKHYQPKLNLY